MHAHQLLHKLVSKSLSFMHKARLSILLKVVLSLSCDGQLQLTALGRNLRGAAKVKNKIKSVDRLLSNKNLFSERHLIYKTFGTKLLKNALEARIIIKVIWN